jgi:hypothetical protein
MSNVVTIDIVEDSNLKGLTARMNRETFRKFDPKNLASMVEAADPTVGSLILIIDESSANHTAEYPQ